MTKRKTLCVCGSFWWRDALRAHPIALSEANIHAASHVRREYEKNCLLQSWPWISYPLRLWHVRGEIKIKSKGSIRRWCWVHAVIVAAWLSIKFTDAIQYHEPHVRSSWPAYASIRTARSPLWIRVPIPKLAYQAEPTIPLLHPISASSLTPSFLFFKRNLSILLGNLLQKYPNMNSNKSADPDLWILDGNAYACFLPWFWH